MTLKKIAELAGVSVSTVSKALSDSREISPQKTKEIQKIAREQGYYAKRQKTAQEYKRFSAPHILIVCPEIISIYYSAVCSCLCRRIAEHGGIAEIILSGFDALNTARITENALIGNSSFDGIIFLNSCEKTAFPIPTVQLFKGSTELDSVFADYSVGMQEALLHLASLNCTNILFAGESLTKTKESAFISLTQKLGLSGKCFISRFRFEEAGYECADHLFTMPEAPQGILCAYDEIALGLIRSLTAKGKQIPRDFQIIGINDIPYSRYSSVPLTTIKTDIEEICRIAVSILLSRIHSSYSAVQHISVQSRLVIRNTTKAEKS